MTILSQIITDQHCFTYVLIKALKFLELELLNTVRNASLVHSSISPDIIPEMIKSLVNSNQRGTTNS